MQRCRQVLKSGGQAVIRWIRNLPPLVQIGLTKLPNSGWAKAHPGHPRPDRGINVMYQVTRAQAVYTVLPIYLVNFGFFGEHWSTGFPIFQEIKTHSTDFCSNRSIRSSTYGKKNISDFPPCRKLVIFVNEFVIFFKTSK